MNQHPAILAIELIKSADWMQQLSTYLGTPQGQKALMGAGIGAGAGGLLGGMTGGMGGGIAGALSGAGVGGLLGHHTGASPIASNGGVPQSEILKFMQDAPRPNLGSPTGLRPTDMNPGRGTGMDLQRGVFAPGNVA